jgi:hypothetical protein
MKCNENNLLPKSKKYEIRSLRVDMGNPGSMLQKALFTFVVLAVLLSTAACSQQETTNAERISTAEAEILVRAMFLKDVPALNPAVEFSLTELTTDEVWQRLRAQVFQVNDGYNMFNTYLIKNKEIVPLGTGVGGMGLTSMCVADLDQDGNPELVYTYSWGSGIHQCRVAMYSADLPAPYSLEARIVYDGNDWTVEKQDDQTVFVEIDRVRRGEDSLRIGQLVLERQGDQVALDIRLYDDLPPGALWQIWRY